MMQVMFCPHYCRTFTGYKHNDLKIRLTKLFSFEMAHALLGYDGPCRNIHGHSYRLEVCVSGEPEQATDNPKLGMVMDFTDLKNIIQKFVLNDLDHCTVLNERSDVRSIQEMDKLFGKILLVPFQPTCENLLIEIRERIIDKLPGHVKLENLRLYETANSFAEISETDMRV
jgi:6-pyruvoyltetrahydropterin/6-carboxytetrahydropterin synthase